MLNEVVALHHALAQAHEQFQATITYMSELVEGIEVRVKTLLEGDDLPANDEKAPRL